MIREDILPVEHVVWSKNKLKWVSSFMPLAFFLQASIYGNSINRLFLARV